MTKKYLAFDLEIAKVFPEYVTDWKELRPLGITCVALLGSDWNEPAVWSPVRGDGTPDGYTYDPQMNSTQLRAFVGYMLAHVKGGYTLLTHNGLSFDFDILAEESGMHAECAELALNHVDTMFHFLCIKGFPVGLDATAKGMGFDGKPDGMDGAQAPLLWQQGEYTKVLEYIAQDVRTTLEVAQAIEERKHLAWITRSGRLSSCSFPNGLLTVKEAMQLPLPDTSWMTDPMTRESMMQWINHAPA